MREVKQNPFDLFMSGVEADVLCMLSRSWDRHSAAGIETICGRSRNQVFQVLTKLVENKVVATINHGRSRSFVLNLHSPVYTQIRAIGAMKLVREVLDDYQEH